MDTTPSHANGRAGGASPGLADPVRPRTPAEEGATITPGIDHIALTVADLDAQVDLLTTAVGLVLEVRSGDFALVSDPSTGLKLELGRSEDDGVHFRHFGVRSDDVDRAHQELVRTGMETSEEPHRRDFAAMYTSFLRRQGCAEVQLVRYDQPAEPDRG